MPKYEFVAVDFDGTLCADAFPEVGEPKTLVIDYVKRLTAEGSKIILYTSREKRWHSARHRESPCMRSMRIRGTRTPRKTV